MVFLPAAAAFQAAAFPVIVILLALRRGFKGA